MVNKFKFYEEAVKYLNDIDQSDFSQLSLARKNDNWTIAHQLATENSLHKQYISVDVLKLVSIDGWTVAHVLAMRGKSYREKISLDILKLARHTDGTTVAHSLASTGSLPEKFMTIDVMKMTDKYNWTVAHQLASYFSYNFPEKLMIPEVLLLSSNDGHVYEKLRKYENLTIDSAKSVLELYLLAMSKYNYPKVNFDKFKGLTDKHGLGKMKQMVKLAGKRDG